MHKILTCLDRWMKHNDIYLTFIVFGIVAWTAFVVLGLLGDQHLETLQTQLVAIAFWGLIALLTHQVTRFITFVVEYFATPKIPSKYLEDDEELELILGERITVNEKPVNKKATKPRRPRKKKESVK
jgi:hypothetical protein